VITVGEDVTKGQTVISRGVRLRPAEIGGLMALGITVVRIAKKIRVGWFPPAMKLSIRAKSHGEGRFETFNAYTLASLVTRVRG